MLFEEFTTSFYGVDALYVLDIYAASEKPEPGVTAQGLAEAIKAHGHRGVEYLGEAAAAVERLKKDLRAGDVFFTMGAGDVWRVGEQLLEGGGAGER
jgi:UDP-N-acetylmuramate--alanine ligase